MFPCKKKVKLENTQKRIFFVTYLRIRTTGWWIVPDGHFAILEPQDQEIGEFYMLHESRATDLEAYTASIGLCFGY